jgi:bacterioferritin-associated ferredoxin
MTRCECAEVSFDEIARRMREDGLSLEEIASRTGCGRLCTACLPDLHAHLGQGR